MKQIYLAATIVATLYSTDARSQEFTYFRYSEKGAVGHMIVVNERASDVPVKPIAISVLSGNTKTQHVCEVRARENTAARISGNASIDATMQVPSGDMNEIAGDTFEITFSKTSAVVSYNKPQSNCGLTATFAGNWKRVKSMEAAIAPK
jgi:hypothetical protein